MVAVDLLETKPTGKWLAWKSYGHLKTSSWVLGQMRLEQVGHMSH